MNQLSTKPKKTSIGYLAQSDANNVCKDVIDIIKTVYRINGQSIKDDELLTDMALSIVSIVKELYRNMTLEELKFALTKGVLGDYGEWDWLSIKTLCKWLKVHWTHPNRKKFRDIPPPHMQLNKNNDMTENEFNTRMIESAVHLFTEFESTGMAIDYSNAVYDFLDSKKVINFTRAEKMEFIEKGKKAYKAAMKALSDGRLPTGRFNPTVSQRKAFLSQLEEAKNETETAKVKFVVEAKKIALLEYFFKEGKKILIDQKILDEAEKELRVNAKNNTISHIDKKSEQAIEVIRLKARKITFRNMLIAQIK